MIVLVLHLYGFKEDARKTIFFTFSSPMTLTFNL